ncbi:S41 family peptidase [Sphingomonas sp. LHG3443-2]|uniref:S41 family peptidase n=1 Tax=Sphingomonas sp. LHG3443-2 TaxID=2804639 RepID=UPI003CE8514E
MRIFLSQLFFSVLMFPVGSSAIAQAPGPAPAAAEAAFDAKEAEAAVTELAKALEENFVFPDAGKNYAAMLRANLAKGAYASFPSAKDFAERVTADLQAVHKDGHLRLRPVTAEMRARRGGPGGGRSGGEERSAVSRSGWLTDGVAYIDFAGFPGNKATIAEVEEFIADHRGASTLIIDARRNGGGGLDEMNLLFRELYAKPTTLVTMDIRQAVEEKNGTPFGEDPTLRKIAGPATVIRREHFVTPTATPGPLAKAKVYLLTSKNTFSAAEHLSLSLKRTGRATLIGEATGGGAHFGGVVPMGTGYAAFIPVGRTFDPSTGNSWEGTGVAPDIAVPADQALAKALELAGAKVDAATALLKLGPVRTTAR